MGGPAKKIVDSLKEIKQELDTKTGDKKEKKENYKKLGDIYFKNSKSINEALEKLSGEYIR